jgi:hypothetical protein
MVRATVRSVGVRVAAWALAAAALPAFAADAPPLLDAATIVQKNAAARGGTEAWQRLQTMAWTGYVESTVPQPRRLPFLLEQKRPSKTRFELVTDGQPSVRIYDGRAGWKLRPNPTTHRPELAPYNDDELRYARSAAVIDGPLMYGVARGGTVTLVGRERTDGREAYIVGLTLPSGESQRLWIDAETFLETRQDRILAGGTGPARVATVLFRDYREFEGVKLPTTIQTGAGPGGASNKLVIERVALNPELDDHTFGRPDTPVSRRNSVIVDTRGAGHGAGGPAPPVP